MAGCIVMERNQIIMKNFYKRKILPQIIIDDYGMLVMANENQYKIIQILHHQQQNQTIFPQNQSSKIQTQTTQNHQVVEPTIHDQKVDASIILAVGKKCMFQKVIVDKKSPPFRVRFFIALRVFVVSIPIPLPSRESEGANPQYVWAVRRVPSECNDRDFL